ncbi:MAG: hypothetical protein M1827_002872 [Pycnora praestabilis]|nr:MAG: hypothetical protein M1827_002872 [Pycnora praestabilis]
MLAPETPPLLSKPLSNIRSATVPFRPLVGTCSQHGGSAKYMYGLRRIVQTYTGLRMESRLGIDPVFDVNLTTSRAYERPRLNERPIYLRVVFFSLAIMQSVIHLVFDYDRVLLPVTKGNVQSTADQRPQILVAPLAQLRALLPGLVQSVLLRSMSMIVLGPLVYSLFLRKTAWSWTLFIAKMLWNLPRSSNPPVIPPYHISLIGRSAYSGFLLVLLWETTNVTFAAYVAQAPLKKEHALTDDSRDPNGSLIAGLRAKKDVPRIFAFWELFYISQRFPNRRKSFFQDIDRKGGATWTQILNICLDEIQGVNIRVIEFHNPPPLAPTPTQQGNPQPLPRLSEPLKQGNVFTNSPAPSTRIEKVQSSVSNVAKWVAQNQTHTSKPPSSPRVTKLLTDGRDKVLSKEHQRQLTPQGIKAQVTTYMLDFLRSPLGVPFHQTLQRRIAAVILGTPYGDLGTILDSIDILTRLAICSLTEDPYGRVQSDVPTIIRTFTSTIPNLESFKRNMPIHWTDVKYKDEGERSVPEVDIIIASLRGGLRELLKAFGEYAENLGLSMGEMRIARETATVGEGE